MKILLISQYFPPDITAASFRIGDTADLLCERGHDVAVICAVPHKVSLPDAVLSAQPYQVERVEIAELSGGGMAGYLRHYFSFVVGAIWKGVGLARRLRPEVVWASSPPLFVAIAGVVVARLAGAKLVMDIRDIWPDSAVGAKQISQGGLFYKLGRWLERWTYTQADAVTCVSRPMADYIGAFTTKPVSIVYNGVKATLADVLPSADKPARKTILYAGNLGRAQGMETLLSAFGAIADRPGASDWDLEIVGAGAIEGDLKRAAAASPHTRRIQFTPPMSKNDVMRYMTDAGLLFLNLDASEVFEKTIPSKVFDYMLIGRPILAGIRGEGASILERTGGNIVFPPSDLEGMSGALLAGILNVQALSERSATNRQIALGEYSRESAVSVLEDVLERVTNGRGR